MNIIAALLIATHGVGPYDWHMSCERWQQRAEEILADEGEDISVLGDETKFIARINPNSTVEEGQKINLAIDPAKLHFFDPETGLAIK